ncbi:hypothetical protein V8Z80_05520 [Orrella sp. JC864]|uniref:hypothetical protein n=1 Tax=Orrella sp. JC864 TaxID=3120298 RepID=UPI0012BCCA67
MKPQDEAVFKEPSATRQEREQQARALDKKDLPPPQAHETRPGKTGHKATQFDGQPQVQETETGTLGPRDDTPSVLPKRQGNQKD